jgi:hypothetical protein
MILVKPKLDFNLLDLEHDEQGRYMSMTYKMQESQFKIINVYAPTTKGAKLNFFKDLQAKIRKNKDERLIMGFNLIRNVILDRKGESFIRQTSIKKH